MMKLFSFFLFLIFFLSGRALSFVRIHTESIHTDIPTSEREFFEFFWSFLSFLDFLIGPWGQSVGWARGGGVGLYID
jgi:hypothetical protein